MGLRACRAGQAVAWFLAAATAVLPATSAPAAWAVGMVAAGLMMVRIAALAAHRGGQGTSGQPVAVAIREARVRPALQWLGKGIEWTPQRAAVAATGAGGLAAIGDGDGRVVRARAIRVPVPVLASHLLVFGQTGSGKTRLAALLAASFIARHPDGALFLFDPKGDADLRAVLRAACADSGRAQAFIELDLRRPGDSVRFDPMRNHLRTTSLASRLSALMPEAHGGSPFAAFAWRQLLVLADALVYTGERPTIASLRAAVEGDGRALLARALAIWSGLNDGYAALAGVRTADERAIARYRATVDKHPASAEPVIDALIERVSHDRTHRAKMIQSLLPLLAALTAGELRALLSPDAGSADTRPVFDSRKVIEQARVFYLGLDVLSDPAAGAALGSLVLADLAQVAGARSRTGGAPVMIMVDEAAELAGEPLLQLLNKSRGAGFLLALMAQTVHDFEARLGSAPMAAALLGNPGNVIALRTADPGTQRFFADALPPIERDERAQSRSIAIRDDARHPGSAATASWQARRAPAPWVAPGALSQLPDLHYFARTSDGRVWRGALPRLVATRRC